MSNLPLSSSPSGRLRQLGPSSLSDYELLTIISPYICEFSHKHDVGSLSRMSVDELMEEVGFSEPSAIKFLSAVELGRRSMLISAMSKGITSPSSAAEILFSLIGGMSQEALVVLCMNTRNQIVHVKILYRGTLNSSAVRVSEIMKVAIAHNAATIIIAHNHPSGDPTPSPEDVHVTRQIREAGKLLDIDVLDHIVIGSSDHVPSYVSLKERGFGFDY